MCMVRDLWRNIIADVFKEYGIIHEKVEEDGVVQNERKASDALFKTNGFDLTVFVFYVFAKNSISLSVTPFRINDIPTLLR